MSKPVADCHTKNDRGVSDGGPALEGILSRRGRMSPPGSIHLVRGLLTVVALIVGFAFAPQATSTTSGVVPGAAMSPGASGDLDWVQTAGGGISADWGIAAAVDASGAAIVTGRFQGAATFGTAGDAVTLTSAGGDDVFLARYLPDGTLDWVQRAGGTETDWGFGVAVDASGAATVTGHFAGAATFGTGDDAVTVTSAGLADVFLARYLPDGTLDWVRHAGGTGFVVGWAVAVEGSGAATVTGYFFGAATFGTGSDAVTVTSDGSSSIEVFVARYRSDGTVDWVQRAGGTGVDDGRGVAVDGSGAATVTGSFEGSATFGTGDDAVTVTSSGSGDVFVARYRPDGTLDWAQRAGGTSSDDGNGVAVDASGAATVTGSFQGSATFGTGDDTVTVTSSGSTIDVFLARYLQDGTLAWAQQAGGTNLDVGRGVAVEGSGAATVTGSFAGSATFGAGAGAVTVSSAGDGDVFLARYLPDGTLDAVQRAGGTESDWGSGVAVDASGAATVTGSFAGTATFGTAVDAVTVTSTGGTNVFVARYGVSVDSVPPTVIVPDDLSVEATGVGGATVDFTATAIDDFDGPLEPVCEPPAGSTFPIGTTTVSCTAIDAAGNIGQASFDVTVQPVAGAAGITTLTEGVEALGLPTGAERSLLGPLSQAERLIGDDNASNDSAVCAKLASFNDAVADRVAEGSLTAEQAALLTTYAHALAVVLGCHTS